ncbi:MAG: CHAT domain-containing protein [Candidatus Eremiobacteraeota bacterium]|nr:CHAT domain-containing protein [Candidatus Eremiobacteraeota bacterium]
MSSASSFDDVTVAKSHLALAEARVTQGDLRLAVDEYLEAELLLLRCGSDRDAVQAATRAAEILFELGDAPTARRALINAAQAADAPEAYDVRGPYLLQRAISEQRAGRPADGVTLAATAVTCVEPGDRPHSLLILGRVQRDVGAFEAALITFNDARACALRVNQTAPAALALSEIAQTWSEAGEESRADAVFAEAALERAATAETEPTHAIRQRSDGIYESLDAGRISAGEAAVAFVSCAREFHEIGDLQAEATARAAAAEAYARAQRWELADMAGEVAYDLAVRSGNRALEVTIGRLVGNTYLRHGEFEDAERVLRQVQATGEALRDRADSAEAVQSIGVMLAAVYEKLALLYHLEFVDPDGNVVRAALPGDALTIAQRTRATNLATWLTIAGAVERSGSPEAAEAFGDLYATETTLEAGAVAHPSRLDAGLRDREKAQHRFEAASSLSVRAVRRALVATRAEHLFAAGERTVFVDLLALPEGVLAYVVDARGLRDADLIPWPRLERLALLERWGRALSNCTKPRAGNAPRGWRTGGAGQLDPTAIDVLRETHDAMTSCILGPLAELVAACGNYERVIVFPHRELVQLPFSSLEQRLEDAAVSVAPNAACLRALENRPRAAAGPLVAFGDATATLTCTTLELQSLGVPFDAAPTTAEIIRRGAQANILHFAGHGYFDSANPYRSGLVVEPAPDGRAEASDPWTFDKSLFTLTDIAARLRLPCCLVAVLSACDTGMPRVHAASEFTSLPSVLFVAGARNVVASLWPAHDVASALLMITFHAMLRAAPSPRPSLALAAARRELRRMTRIDIRSVVGRNAPVPAGAFPFDHPVYADSFQHYGAD